MRKAIIILFACFLNFVCIANPIKIKALNNYINFTNESIHGLLIVHRLLENYNQDINKYVDLQSNQLNFFTNKDLPGNIFEDTESLFFEVSPAEWYKIAKKDGIILKNYAKLNAQIDKIKKINNQINQLRFEVEKLIFTLDLNIRPNLDRVYQELEKGVTLYESFYTEQKQLEQLIKREQKLISTNFDDPLYNSFQSVHQAVRKILVALREKKDLGFRKKIEKLTKAYSVLKKQKQGQDFSRKEQRHVDYILELTERIITSSKRFFDYADVDEEYKLYGKFYFYYNADMVTKFNRYGPGFVFEMNKIMDLRNWQTTNFLELPHFYQVIYPKIIMEHKPIASLDNNIEILPQQLKERKIINSNRKITLDKTIKEISFYDHKLQDGDRVSINFNGDWLLENHSLESKPIKLKFDFNTTGKNYLIIHADNVGSRPPNTVAISYTYKGAKKKILLESDLNTSELIEIELRQ